jgi:hypothetical protein
LSLRNYPFPMNLFTEFYRFLAVIEIIINITLNRTKTLLKSISYEVFTLDTISRHTLPADDSIPPKPAQRPIGLLGIF